MLPPEAMLMSSGHGTTSGPAGGCGPVAARVHVGVRGSASSGLY